MPWGWECRQKLIKQVPLGPTERKGTIFAEQATPGPQSITLPPVIGGPGFSHIRRAPAYTFGHRTPAEIKKPAVDPKAPLISIQGLVSKGGKFRITNGVMLPPAHDLTVLPLPGPGQYRPVSKYTRKQNPKYSLRPPPRPAYEAPDCWSPAPNMYLPPAPGRSAPAHSITNHVKELSKPDFPGPGAYNENYKYVKHTIPTFSFGSPFKPLDLKKHVPAPNVHCDKLFKTVLPTIPAPTFGIKHSPFIPMGNAYLLPEKAAIATTD